MQELPTSRAFGVITKAGSLEEVRVLGEFGPCLRLEDPLAIASSVLFVALSSSPSALGAASAPRSSADGSAAPSPARAPAPRVPRRGRAAPRSPPRAARRARHLSGQLRRAL